MKRFAYVMTACLMGACLLTAACGSRQETPTIEYDARTEQETAVTATEEPTATAEPETVTMELAPTETETPAEEQPVETADAPETAEEEASFYAVLEGQGLLDGLGAYSEEDIYDYYGIDPSRCEVVFACVDVAGSAKEIVYVHADAAYIQEIKTLLESHVSALAEQYAGYDADGAKMLKDAKFLVGDTDILLIVAPEQDAYESAYTAYVG